MLEAEIYKKKQGFSLAVKLEAAAGEVVGVLGASGCGKSMTLKCIAGIETPDEGHIALDGHVLFDSAAGINLPPQQRHAGYLFQSYALFPHMTAAENIMAGIRDKERRSMLVKKYLELFYLQELAGRYPRELSGGQQQRVALARIFASEPEALLLDEPFSALDSYLKWKVELELQKVLESCQKPILFVSHSRDEVYELCGRIAVLNDGHLESLADKKSLFQNPETLAASKLTGCKNHSVLRVLGAHQVRADGWGLELELKQDIAEPAGYVGIRAHDIRLVPPGETAGLPNVFLFRVRRVLEEPFSIVLMVQADGGHDLLRAELSKPGWQAQKEHEKVWLALPPEKIFLLRA